MSQAWSVVVTPRADQLAIARAVSLIGDAARASRARAFARPSPPANARRPVRSRQCRQARDERHRGSARMPWRGAINTAVLAGDGRLHDDLADMAGTLHQAERADDLVVPEGSIGKRRQLALVEQIGKLREQARALFRQRVQQLVGIDAEIAYVAAKRPSVRFSCRRRSRACPVRGSGRRALAATGFFPSRPRRAN